MTAMDIRVETDQPLRPDARRHQTTLFAVVGFDGSPSSRTALDTAAELIQGRDGHLEVVYVAHIPPYVGMSAPALVGVREGFDEIAAELNSTARATLDDREPRWHFQRRDGAITDELLAAAAELRRRYGQDATVLIVVGASALLAHHIAGSVAVGLARDAGFPVLVVPASSGPGHPDDSSIDSSSYLG